MRSATSIALLPRSSTRQTWRHCEFITASTCRSGSSAAERIASPPQSQIPRPPRTRPLSITLVVSEMTGSSLDGAALKTACGGSEHSPLIASSPPSPVGSPLQGQVHPLLQKYVVEPQHHLLKLDGSCRVVTSTYGTLALNQQPTDDRLDAMLGVKKRTAARGSASETDTESSQTSNNQSETDSDSDGSCGSMATQATSTGLQSILRIRTGDFSCRTLQKKQSSVDFAIDIIDDESDDEEDEYLTKDKRKSKREPSSRRKSCASRCVPRRLTLEEKAALYRVRPDLELTPMPILLRDIEEMRRRRQRRIVFTMLGGTLIILMMVVMYYVLSQV